MLPLEAFPDRLYVFAWLRLMGGEIISWNSSEAEAILNAMMQ
jgi:hypothetical protein